jgi:hypothetical protein
MRHTVPLLLLLILFLTIGSGCKKRAGCTDPSALNYDPEARKSDNSCITVQQVRMVPLFQFTAIWNPPCGSYGTKAFKEALSLNPATMIGIASHGSESQPDALTSNFSAQLFETFGVTNLPHFAIGGTNLGTNPNADSLLSAMLAEPIVANGTATFFIEGNTINIDAIARFFRFAEGEFTLSIFVLESGVEGGDNAPPGLDQMGDNTNTYTHDYILRGGPAPHVMGDVIAIGSISSTTSKRFRYTMEAQTGWRKDRLDVVGIIWRKEAGGYAYVNAFRGARL